MVCVYGKSGIMCFTCVQYITTIRTALFEIEI